jgi:hypothetical protein
MNRYAEYATETEAEIAHLKGRIERFTARGLTARVPAIEAEIARLERRLPTLRGTAKLVGQMYGEVL